MNENNDALWVTAADTDPKQLARQLLALRDWFQLPAISVREAACLIAGVLPAQRIGDRRNFGARLPGIGACLPGTVAWEYNREIFVKVISDQIDGIERLLEEKRPFRGRSLTAFVNRGIASGYSPPWLDAACADQECRKHLSPSILDGKINLTQHPMTSTQVASRGGKAKKNNDVQREAYFSEFRRELLAGSAVTDILNLFVDEYGDAPPQSTAYDWAKEIRAEPNVAKSP